MLDKLVHSLAGRLGERPAAPLHDHRIDLGNRDPRSGRQDAERGAQGEAHAETADQHPRPRQPGDGTAGQLGPVNSSYSVGMRTFVAGRRI